MAANRGKKNFPDTANNKRCHIDRQEVSRAMNHIVPNACGIVASKQTNKHTAQPLLGDHAHIGHNAVGLETNIPHTKKHGWKSRQPNSDHDAL